MINNKKIILGLLTILLLVWILIFLNQGKKTYSVSDGSDTIYQLVNPVAICQAVGNKKIKVYVEDINNNSTEVKMQESNCEAGNYSCCSNTIYYNDNMAKYTDDSYESWVWHGIANTGPYYIEGREVETNLYGHFAISNRNIQFNTNGILKKDNTLKSGETSSIEIRL